MTKRPARPEDEEFLWRLYAATRAEEVAQWGWPAPQQEQFLRMQYRARCQSYAAAYPDSEHSILLDGEIGIGAMIVSRTGAESRLVDISLLPEHRGRGAGAAAIGELIAETKQRRLPLRLTVLRANRALRLYQRLGFMPKSEDAMYIEMEYEPVFSSEDP